VKNSVVENTDDSGLFGESLIPNKYLQKFSLFPHSPFDEIKGTDLKKPGRSFNLGFQVKLFGNLLGGLHFGSPYLQKTYELGLMGLHLSVW